MAFIVRGDEMTTEREKFEKWASQQGLAANYEGDGFYRETFTQRLWQTWQAARADSEKEVAELRAQVESLTQQLHDARMAAAKYEEAPVHYYYLTDDATWLSITFEQYTKAKRAKRQTMAVIAAPASTAHLETLIAEAVAKEQERCAEYALDWFSASQCPDMSLLDYIRARAQKGG